MKLFILLSFLILIGLRGSAQVSYKDGTYIGNSQSIYKEEPFVGISTIIIQGGLIDSVNFYIVDTSKNELFDARYEKHFAGVNEEYVQQCRKDWAGTQRYPKVLMAKKKLSEVDAVSGATWSFNMFRDATSVALKKAAVK